MAVTPAAMVQQCRRPNGLTGTRPLRIDSQHIHPFPTFVNCDLRIGFASFLLAVVDDLFSLRVLREAEQLDP